MASVVCTWFATSCASHEALLTALRKTPVVASVLRMASIPTAMLMTPAIDQRKGCLREFKGGELRSG
jgi:hypothetical protein